MDRSGWKLLAGLLAGALIGIKIGYREGSKRLARGSGEDSASPQVGESPKEDVEQPRPGNGLFPTAGKDERDWYLARIDPQTSRLAQNEVSQAHMIVTLVSGANAGGAVAMLAYIAQLNGSQPGRLIPHSTEVLGLFIVGFVLSMFFAIDIYYASAHRLENWDRQLGAFFSGQISWRALWNGHKDSWWQAKLPHYLGWLSFLFFLGGAGWGVTEMLLVKSIP